MIELRWLDAPMLVSTGGLAEGMRMTIPRKQILQYRFRVHPDAAPASYESKDGTNFYAYSAWQDVPTVKYEELYAAPDSSKEKP